MADWPHHLAVYGPPGAGKTALVREALERGYASRDLEDVGDTYLERSRFLASLEGDGQLVLFGAADLTPEDFPPGTRFVLLAPSPDELVRRVRRRADQRDHKWIEHALQVRREHLLMADQGVFDLVIREDGPTNVVLDLIAETFVGAAR